MLDIGFMKHAAGVGEPSLLRHGIERRPRRQRGYQRRTLAAAFLRNGFGPRKIYHLARESFADTYADHVLKGWMKVFFGRFFSQQFKRTTLPPGPKVGTVSLSPRGDWRMPDEATAAALIATIDAL